MTTIKFNYALYRNGQTEERMYVDQILRHHEFLEIKENLYCPGSGCSAKLSLTRLSNGTDYLRKHKSYKHSENCDYLELGEVTEKSITDYISINGRMTDDGINNRKLDAMKTLDEYLNPSELPREDKLPKRKPKKKKGPEGEVETNIGVKIVYDPDAEIVKKFGKGGNTRTLETRFYKRLPFQISVKDSNKNIKTSAVIEEFVFGESDTHVEIKAKLEDAKVTFILPEAFFNNSRNGLVPEELMNYLKIIGEYIEKNDQEIFLTTMCQSRKINMEDIALWIFEPEFMSFQTRGGAKFITLTSLVLAIQTKAI